MVSLQRLESNSILHFPKMYRNQDFSDWDGRKRERERSWMDREKELDPEKKKKRESGRHMNGEEERERAAQQTVREACLPDSAAIWIGNSLLLFILKTVQGKAMMHNKTRNSIYLFLKIGRVKKKNICK